MRHEPPLCRRSSRSAERLAAIVSRALAKDPAARFPSAREMRDALAALRADRTSRLASRARATAASPSPPASRSRWPLPRRSAGSACRDSRLRWAQNGDSRDEPARDGGRPRRRLSRGPARDRRVAAGDPQVQAAWNGVTPPVPVDERSAGAEVAIRSLPARTKGGSCSGRTPVVSVCRSASSAGGSRRTATRRGRSRRIRSREYAAHADRREPAGMVLVPSASSRSNASERP